MGLVRICIICICIILPHISYAQLEKKVVSDIAYGASWNGVTTKAPSKNAIYDKIETVVSDDVSGPASSTDNAIARFDGTTGKIVQNSGVTIDDSNNVSGNSYTSTVAIGTQPYVATSTTLNTNLNADLLDGENASAFQDTDAGLTSLAGLTYVSTSFVKMTGADTFSLDTTTYAPLASPTFTGTVTIPTPFTLGAVSVLPTGTELNFVDGVTSAIQTQLDAKQAAGSYITALTGEVTATGPGSVAATIANDAVTYAKMQNVSASNVVLGRISPSAGDVEEISTSGTGAVVRATSAALTTPTIGAATATSIAIGANTLDTSEWANLDGVNQALATTSTPQFAKLGLGAAASASAIHYINSNAGGTNALWINAGSSNTSPAIQVDAAAGRVIIVNKTGGGETIFYLIQNDTYNNKFMECYGGGETPLLFEVNGLGGIWTIGDCSALTFTDRTPYPETLKEAYDSVLSIEGVNGKVNHEKLTSFVKSVAVKTKYNELTKQNENIGTEVGRNLSATVSAQNSVIKDLISRITALENK